MAYQTFKNQLEHMKSLAKENEYVRVEICGIEAIHLQVTSEIKTGDATLTVQGKDEHGMDCVLICPAGNFFAKLAIVPKKKESTEIGFKMIETEAKIE